MTEAHTSVPTPEEISTIISSLEKKIALLIRDFTKKEWHTSKESLVNQINDLKAGISVVTEEVENTMLLSQKTKTSLNAEIQVIEETINTLLTGISNDQARVPEHIQQKFQLIQTAFQKILSAFGGEAATQQTSTPTDSISPLRVEPVSPSLQETSDDANLSLLEEAENFSTSNTQGIRFHAWITEMKRQGYRKFQKAIEGWKKRERKKRIPYVEQARLFIDDLTLSDLVQLRMVVRPYLEAKIFSEDLELYYRIWYFQKHQAVYPIAAQRRIVDAITAAVNVIAEQHSQNRLGSFDPELASTNAIMRGLEQSNNTRDSRSIRLVNVLDQVVASVTSDTTKSDVMTDPQPESSSETVTIQEALTSLQSYLKKMEDGITNKQSALAALNAALESDPSLKDAVQKLIDKIQQDIEKTTALKRHIVVLEGIAAEIISIAAQDLDKLLDSIVSLLEAHPASE